MHKAKHLCWIIQTIMCVLLSSVCPFFKYYSLCHLQTSLLAFPPVFSGDVNTADLYFPQ